MAVGGLVGVNSRTSLDPRWTRHNTPVAAGFMIATITIKRKLPEQPALKYDSATGKYTGGLFETVVTSVKARIQPFGVIGDMVVGQDTTSRRLMRFQIENVETGINQDDMIEVLECKDNPELKTFSFEVRGTISSSNAWLTDIIAEADTKRRD